MVNSDKELTTKLSKSMETSSKESMTKESVTKESVTKARKTRKRVKSTSTAVTDTPTTALSTKDWRYTIINNISRTIWMTRKFCREKVVRYFFQEISRKVVEKIDSIIDIWDELKELYVEICTLLRERPDNFIVSMFSLVGTVIMAIFFNVPR